ncbi:MAG TPA: UDP-N-acetylmuramoyl-L-alanine--D-glutamate ligase [Methylophilaceae bacterium]|nr:UDP-N-acetylmuramoyl-L-alanine--D-glutamate ligase [Methylophilaceae bacterium]
MKLALKGKKVVVLGLGDTGLSALRWLQGQGAVLSVADSRTSPPNLALLHSEMPQVKVYTGPFTPQAFAGAELIVASPGVAVAGPMAEPQVTAAQQRGIPVIGDIELFAQFKSAGAKVIAITGANGKSTVTMLVGEMCKAAGLRTIIAGNIGLPVLVALGMEEPDVYVLELSSFQLETTNSLQPDAATVLNVTEDHMDRYHGMADYAEAKARVFNGSGVQVLNRDDRWSYDMALPGRKHVTFGTDAPSLPDDYGLLSSNGRIGLMHGGTELLELGDLRIAGLHNAANALAALALCRAINLRWEPLLDTLRHFKGLPHRVEWIAEIDGIAFYDDSKGTNVGATCAALAGLPRKVVLIAGGDGKGQDFSPLREPVMQNARAVVLIGRDGPQIEKALQDTGVLQQTESTLEGAVKTAFALAQPGDAVLLSPACASFDMFRNYAHRAEVFVSAVKKLEAAR